MLRKGTMNFYFPNCDPNVWNDMNDLTERICEVTKEISGNLDLAECRKVLMDEFDQ